MSYTYEELKEKIMALYDPDDLVEILQVSTEDILDRFEERVLYYSNVFVENIEDTDDDFNPDKEPYEY